ncbi:hypothetical protein GCM10018952_52810 [Streptosporangium vulgare]
MRPLIEAGHVYLSQPHLYKIKWDRKGGGQHSYALLRRERDVVIQAGIDAGKPDPRAARQRAALQGSGRDERRQLWETTMNHDTAFSSRSPSTTRPRPTSCSACSWVRTSKPAAPSHQERPGRPFLDV